MKKNKTSFVPRSLLGYSFLGVVPACALGVGLAACGSSSNDIALAIIAYDAQADGDAPPDGKKDGDVDSGIIALADIGFRSDTADAFEAGDTFGASDTSGATDATDASDATDALDGG